MRLASILPAAFLLSVSLPLLGACADAGDPDDELAGESDLDGDEGKADDSGTYTYYDLRSDTRRCASPMCGGVFVDRVNRAETACTGGNGGPIWAERCYAADIDWSESGLAQDQIDVVMGQIGALDGGRVLVRGHLRSQSWGADLGSFGRLYVTEAWVAQTGDASDGMPDGVFVRVKDAGIRCITSPCESSSELKLNSSLSAMIAGIDFTPSGATQLQVQAATESLLYAGVIIAGYRYTIYDNGSSARGRRANQVFTRLVPGASDPCFVGGCSGQVCSAQDGVVTTCDWQPEYACYADATCERQPSGACGWTPTEALDSCLANPTAGN